MCGRSFCAVGAVLIAAAGQPATARVFDAGSVGSDRSVCDSGIGDLASEACSRLLRGSPGDAAAYKRRGNASYGKNDYDHAIADYDQVIRLDPGDAGAYYDRGNAYYHKGDYERAIADYDQAIGLDPGNPVLYASRGNPYMAKGEYDRALADFDAAIRLAPGLAGAYNNRGNLYNDRRDYDRAIADYDRALGLDPRFALAYNGRGDAYAGKGDYDRAISDFDQAIWLDAHSARAYASRADAYNDKGDYQRAISDYGEAIRLDPDNAVLYTSRGNCYDDNGDHDLAISDYDRAIVLAPNQPAAYYNRGLSFHRSGEDDRAIADYDQAIGLDPDYAAAYNNRGRVYGDRGDNDRAVADFDAAIRLDPEFAFAYNNRGSLYGDSGDYDRAISDYDRAIEIDPTYVHAYANRAEAFEAKGDRGRAIADFQQALKLNPSLARARHGLARVTRPSYLVLGLRWHVIDLLAFACIVAMAFLPPFRKYSRLPVTDDPGRPYRVYCRDFDIEIDADKLETVIVAVPPAALDETSAARLAEVENDLAATSADRAAAVSEAAARIRGGCSPELLNDTIVSLLIDHSGSMRGTPILIAATVAMTASDLLDGLGVKHEILGFTTVRWRGGLSREKWLRDGRPAYPGRLNDQLHILYCRAGGRLLPSHLATMRRPELLKENIDGEAIEWAAARLRGHDESRKCLIVVSDGAPVDDATLAANGGSYLERHLRSVIKDIGKAADIRLAAVGIGHDVGRYYAHGITAALPAELVGAVIGVITEMLSPPPQPDPGTDPTDKGPV